MAKHDERFKLKIVQRYLSGVAGTRVLSRQHKLSERQVRRWIAAYREHGAKGLRRKGASYDAKFKLVVLNRMWTEHWSAERTAMVFDIRSPGHIGKWERQYYAGGIDALVPRRGRSQAMNMKPPKPPEREGDAPRTLEELLKENEYLRAENAYLKKLDALIQQKRAEQKKRGS